MSRKRLLWIGIVLFLILPIVVPMFTLNLAKRRVLASLQRELGRRVSASDVRLDLFPLPALEIDDVRIAEDPAFGREDPIAAEAARLTPSLWPLVRGRLRFSGIHLDRPNINLVRTADGRWNVAALLDRAGAHLTAGQAPAAAAAFPYIDWTGGRINFKINQTKSRVYLGNADGSLTRNGHEWQLHCRFEPLRTDVSLSDTGTILVDARWKPGSTPAAETPFRAAIHLENSFLAGSTALLAGHDLGLEGILNADLGVQGTPARFQVTGNFRADALRRWDLLPPGVNIRGAMALRYSAASDTVHVEHLGDPGFQRLRIAGTVHNLLTHPHIRATLTVHAMPLADLMVAVRAVKADLPQSLQAEGAIDGSAALNAASGKPMALRAAFTVQNPGWNAAGVSLRAPRLRLTAVQPRRQPRALLELLPATIKLHDGAQRADLRISAAISTQGFTIRWSCPQLDRHTAQALAMLWGVPSPWPAYLRATGAAQLGLSAPWTSLRHPVWRGRMILPTATFRLAPAAPAIALRRVRIDFGALPAAGLAASTSAPKTHVGFIAQLGSQRLHGTVVPGEAGQPTRFSLQTARLDANRLAPPFEIRRRSGFLAHWLERAPRNPWTTLNARGTFICKNLIWNGFHATVSTNVVAKQGVWRLRDLTMKFGNGRRPGRFRGRADLDGTQLTLSGKAHALPMAALLAGSPVAGRMTGTLYGSLNFSRNLSQSWRRARAEGHLRIDHGHLLRTPGSPSHLIRFQRLLTSFHLANGRLRFQPLRVKEPGGWESGSAEVRGRLNSGLVLSTNLSAKAARAQHPQGPPKGHPVPARSAPSLRPSPSR